MTNTEALLEAEALIRDHHDRHHRGLPMAGISILARTTEHLNAELLKLVYDRPPVTTEQQATALLKTAAAELHYAGTALDAAADGLKFRNGGALASQIKQAALRILDSARQFGWQD